MGSKSNISKLATLIALLIIVFNPLRSYSQDSIYPKERKVSILAVPLAYYSPETRFGFGAAGISSFHIQKTNELFRPSSVQFLTSYTLNKQFLLQVPFQLFWDHDRNSLYGEVDYFKFPYQFFGIGNDIDLNTFARYTAKFTRYKFTYLRSPVKNWYFGGRFFFDHLFEITKEDHELFDKPIIGIEGGRSAGLGFVVLYDTRDNIFYPSKGSYIELAITGYGKASYSEYSFSNYILDSRKYLTLKEGTVLALQGTGHFSGGGVPFSELATIGGSRRMRGYYEGSVQDRNLIVTQVEIRQNIIGRLGVATFAGLSNVFPYLNKFVLGDTRFSGGAGLRYMFNKKEKINLRIDIGFGKNTSGFYFTIGEAF